MLFMCVKLQNITFSFIFYEKFNINYVTIYLIIDIKFTILIIYIIIRQI